MMLKATAKPVRMICVDDDPMLLASTRRQMHRKIPDCEILFFENAIDALESMDAGPADVVLSDLRMPQMDGVEFLTLVAERFPDTIRLAWTGQLEVARLEKALAVAHQVLCKPCPTQTLIDIISAAVSLGRQLPSERSPLSPPMEQRDSLTL